MVGVIVLKITRIFIKPYYLVLSMYLKNRWFRVLQTWLFTHLSTMFFRIALAFRKLKYKYWLTPPREYAILAKLKIGTEVIDSEIKKCFLFGRVFIF